MSEQQIPCIHTLLKTLNFGVESNSIGEETLKMLEPHFEEIKSAVPQFAEQVGKDHYLTLSMAFVWHALSERNVRANMERNPQFNERETN